MRRYSRTSSLFTLALFLTAVVFTRAQAAPNGKGSSTPQPGSVSYQGTFLKTLAKAPDAASDWRPLQDKYGRFVMAVPSDWAEGSMPADRDGMMYSLVAGESQPRDDFSANIVISQTEVPADYKMKLSMLSDLTTQTVKNLKSYRFVLRDKAFTTVDRIPCIVIGGTLDYEDKKLRHLELRLVHRGINYLVVFTALDKYYPQYEPLFARLTKTLAFEREQPTASPTTATPSALPRP